MSFWKRIMGIFDSSGIEVTDATNHVLNVAVTGYPSNGIAVKNPTGTPVYVRPYDGTNYGPTGDAAARAVYITDAHYSYAHVTGDSAVKSAAGKLHIVNINKCSTGGVLTIYDNTSEGGATIAIIAIATLTNPLPPLIYDIAFSTGLYFGFDGTLVADITVSYI